MSEYSELTAAVKRALVRYVNGEPASECLESLSTFVKHTDLETALKKKQNVIDQLTRVTREKARRIRELDAENKRLVTRLRGLEAQIEEKGPSKGAGVRALKSEVSNLNAEVKELEGRVKRLTLALSHLLAERKLAEVVVCSDGLWLHLQSGDFCLAFYPLSHTPISSKTLQAVAESFRKLPTSVVCLECGRHPFVPTLQDGDLVYERCPRCPELSEGNDV